MLVSLLFLFNLQNILKSTGGKRCGKTSFVEHRTFLHLYHSFHRLWIFLLMMFQVCQLHSDVYLAFFCVWFFNGVQLDSKNYIPELSSLHSTHPENTSRGHTPEIFEIFIPELLSQSLTNILNSSWRCLM